MLVFVIDGSKWKHMGGLDFYRIIVDNIGKRIFWISKYDVFIKDEGLRLGLV